MMRRRSALAAVLILLLAAPALAAPAAVNEDAWIGPYPPLDEVYREIKELVALHPDLVTLEEIGRSVENRPILALRIGRRDGLTRPAALYTANIHASEVIASRVALGLARLLVEGDGQDPRVTALLDQTDVWIVPVLNPDGYHRVLSTGGSGGEVGGRKNARGVDLNRNYPLAPGAHSRHPMAGNRRPRSAYYMGPAQLSEPETAAIARLADAHPFYFCINGHSVAGKYLYPHCYTRTPARHAALFAQVGRAYAAAQTGTRYQVEVSYSWYPTLGDMDDFLYMQHGILSNTVEHGTLGRNLAYALRHPDKFMFWGANPANPDPWVASDAAGAAAAISKALELTGGKPLPLAECRNSGQ